ncbi:hypothetical protein B0T24DRAFT_619604 [Lasiosphaeria ovina]|uniref:RING-type E3 ubiquitin transferase n=1 Tax=Lasiosphaeria ovina TaxID=92902 RepID=A0AAE0NAG1_9PEZI|nr:hypothetical protein B0T24DRAFT_619604 [Lasiosphaeria ovina]
MRATASGAAADIQAQVLQMTLAEIPTSRDRATVDNNLDNDNDNADGDVPDCCVICLDAISEPCSALPCAHSNFDLLCLLSWLEQRPECPLCKSTIYKVRYAGTPTGESIFHVPNAPRNQALEGEGPSSQPPSRRNAEALSWAAELHRGSQRRRRLPSPPRSPDEAIQGRRRVYRHQLYSLHIGSNRVSQYRPAPTPAIFASTPHLVSRARLWIRRELQVFAFLSDSHPDVSSVSSENQQIRRRNNAEFLLEYVVAIIKTVDVQDSAGQAEDMLADFLGRDHSRLFLHEFRSWLRSPCQTLTAWDREVQYPEVPRKRELSSRDSEGEDDSRTSSLVRPRRSRRGDHWRPHCDRKRRKMVGFGRQNE